MREMRVAVATHGHCFDGMASAAAFTRLFRATRGDADFVYRACDYGTGGSAVPAAWLDGDENAILDFRYTALDRLTWWFDHHGTAFRDDADRARFEGGHPRERHYDPSYGSCTRLIRDVAASQFGVTMPELDELVRWAEIIDTAGFPSAEAALDRSAPAMRLMTVIEHFGDAKLLTSLVPRLLAHPLDEIATSDDVTALYAPLAAMRTAALARLEKAGVVRENVAFADLSADPSAPVEKFGMYLLFPAAHYAVVLSRGNAQVKISVGWNPWTNATRTHHIGEICQRFGGGGHPVVGAIAIVPKEIERARDIAASICAELAR